MAQNTAFRGRWSFFANALASRKDFGYSKRMQAKKQSAGLRLLIVDDEESIRTTTTMALEAIGYETAAVSNRDAALKQAENQHFDVAFLDLKLGEESGLELLPELLKVNPQLDVVVFTAYASIEIAVEAMRRGAVDFIAKPFTPEQIRQVLARIVGNRKLRERVAELESRLASDSPEMDLTTSEPAMQQVLDLAFKAAGTPATILLLGDSGTGKSILARAIHANSPQKEHSFVTVSCPSLSRELLESELFGHIKGAFTGAVSDKTGKVAQADEGTLFLDEIGEMPPEIQPKLLRLLQEKEYERLGETKTRRANVRVIAATNRDLEKAVEAGRFREDLFYRLNVISIHMPPLKQRRNDIQRIAGNYLRFFARQCGKHIRQFTKEAEEAMRDYTWPGNLRELRNVIERSVILASADEINLADLPSKMQAGGPFPANHIQVGARVSLEALELEHISRVVQQAATMEEAAKILGIDPATLYRKRKKMSHEQAR